MELGKPSRTALATAALRAAHQVVERGNIFTDPLAMRILGSDAEDVIRDAEREPSRRRGLRLFVTVRSRFAEDALAVAVARGVRQLVVLGAGLDTYAYRGTFENSLRIFEVDDAATQAWKRQKLANAAIPIPPTLTFAGIDFERESLAEGLAVAGFDPEKRTFFTWLGVVPYLTEEAVYSALRFMAGLGGAHVVFDYANPPTSIPEQDARVALAAVAARAAALGEGIKSYFESEVLHAKLTALGFGEVEDLGPMQIAARYIPNRTGSFSGGGAHIVHAKTV